MEPSGRPDIFNNEGTKEAYNIIVDDDMKKQLDKLIFFWHKSPWNSVRLCYPRLSLFFVYTVSPVLSAQYISSTLEARTATTRFVCNFNQYMWNNLLFSRLLCSVAILLLEFRLQRFPPSSPCQQATATYSEVHLPKVWFFLGNITLRETTT